MNKKTLDAITSMVYVSRQMLAGRTIQEDDQKLRASGLFEDWGPGSYAVGDVRNVEGQTWECFQAHNTAIYPDISPEGSAWRTFWRPLHGKTPETARPFVEVQGAHDTYKAGEFMIWTGGTVRECLRETNFNPNDDPTAWSQPTAAVTLAGAAEAVGLEGMTVKQLKTYARERGIALTGITLKEDIIKAIMAAL